jgi:aspartate/methionine/tyrosine aminotransferase
VVVTPLWPNLVEIPKILSGNVECVALSCRDGEWSLDLDRLMAALTPDTRALLVNSPNNPTGWTLTRDEQRAILERCRQHGTWLIADDVYERLYYRENTSAAPSFLDIADADERVVSTNSFSKSWLMTGWRLGWIVAPRALMPDLGKLIEYNTSCSPAFVQHAGVAAITEGEPTVVRTRERFRRARDFLTGELARLPRVQVRPPAGAMYAFFRVEGLTDSLAFCKKLVHEARLGLAPGSAFGPEGEGCVRWCFASDEARLADGVARLGRALRSP